MANYLERSRHYWLKVGLDGLLLAISFFIIYGLKRGKLAVEPRFIRFLPILFGSWFLITIMSKKFHLLETKDYFQQIRPFWQSAVVLTVALTMILYVVKGVVLSRLIVYGTLALYCVFEIALLTLRRYLLREAKERPRPSLGVLIFLLELGFINLIFVALHFFKKDTFRISERYQLALLGICIVWLIISLMVHRFRVSTENGYLPLVKSFWTSEILIALLVCFVVFVFEFENASRTIVLESLLAFIVFENGILIAIHLARPKVSTGVEDEESRPQTLSQRFEQWWGTATGKYRYGDGSFHSDLLKRKLETTYLSKSPELAGFLDEILDLPSFPVLEAVFLYSPHLYNIEILDDASLSFFLNLEQINNIRWINKAFIAVNRKLKPGGVMIGCYQSLDQRKEEIYERHPWILAKIVSIFDFLFARVMPKLPLAKKIYFFLSKGADRALSNTELSGRLYYCGFEILAVRRINHHFYFIARKAKEPSTDPHPSYGLFFKQRRVGLGGKIINVYKTRTMHPFAEYLHTEIMKRNELESSGKVSNDIRIAYWGRKIRRVYLDEMPMLVNWLSKDLKFVGVRPLSESFFATYPENLKKERIKVKPGVFPPYYADLPGNIEEVWESERKYIERYLKRPIRTDLSYLIKGLYNIIFRHARSA
jgi:lipopolysaccharide/colanic/teichoic acid biosynthesis glycosyltransferase